jgi:hypothetical protein
MSGRALGCGCAMEIMGGVGRKDESQAGGRW